MKRILTLACMALALAACGTIRTAHDLATTPVCEGRVIDEKLWYAAEAAYNVPAQAYVEANSRALVSPALKAKVKPILQNMYEVLKTARLAYRACDAASLQAKVTALEKLRDQVMPLIPSTQ